MRPCDGSAKPESWPSTSSIPWIRTWTSRSDFPTRRHWADFSASTAWTRTSIGMTDRCRPRRSPQRNHRGGNHRRRGRSPRRRRLGPRAQATAATPAGRTPHRRRSRRARRARLDGRAGPDQVLQRRPLPRDLRRHVAKRPASLLLPQVRQPPQRDKASASPRIAVRQDASAERVVATKELRWADPSTRLVFWLSRRPPTSPEAGRPPASRRRGPQSHARQPRAPPAHCAMCDRDRLENVISPHWIDESQVALRISPLRTFARRVGSRSSRPRRPGHQRRGEPMRATQRESGRHV